MKNLKVLLVIVTFLGALTASNAQRIVKVYPKYGTVVTTVHKPKLIVHQGVKFHFAAGVWYKTRGKHFVVCAAPRGISLRRLPRGHKIVYIKGRKFYAYKGIRYQKIGRVYKVVYV